MSTNLFGLMRKHPEIQVDDEDLKHFGFYTCSLQSGYIHVTLLNRDVRLLHRLIVNPPADLDVDHIDRNRLNNRKENLRLATKSEQAANKTLTVLNTSGFKGVSFHNKSGKWRASISVKFGTKSQHLHLGLFQNPIEAAAAYDRAALKHQGEFANLNFPKETV